MKKGTQNFCQNCVANKTKKSLVRNLFIIMPISIFVWATIKQFHLL
jgi:hypothetical protein